jgi:hypothetical protein
MIRLTGARVAKERSCAHLETGVVAFALPFQATAGGSAAYLDVGHLVLFAARDGQMQLARKLTACATGVYCFVML